MAAPIVAIEETELIPIFLFLGVPLIAIIILVLVGVLIGASFRLTRVSKEWLNSGIPANWPITIEAKCRLGDGTKASWVPVSVIFDASTISIVDGKQQTRMQFPREEVFAGTFPKPSVFTQAAAGLSTKEKRIELIPSGSSRWFGFNQGGLSGRWWNQQVYILGRRLQLAQSGHIPDDSISKL